LAYSLPTLLNFRLLMRLPGLNLRFPGLYANIGYRD